MNEFAWASGLFEGEGCLRVSRHVPLAQMSMTDEDSVRRFAAAFPFGRVNGPYCKGGVRKPFWMWSVEGFEKTQALIAMIWGGLGVRRRAKAREILDDTRDRRLVRDPLTGRYIASDTLKVTG